MTAAATTLLEALAAYLAERTELGVGTDLYLALLPEDKVLASKLTHTGGPARGFSPVDAVAFQVLTRGREIATARARAIALHDAVLDAARRPLRNVDLGGGWRALSIDPMQPPTDLGATEGGAWQVVFNLEVHAVKAVS
jgi:hypothetical protein